MRKDSGVYLAQDWTVRRVFHPHLVALSSASCLPFRGRGSGATRATYDTVILNTQDTPLAHGRSSKEKQHLQSYVRYYNRQQHQLQH